MDVNRRLAQAAIRRSTVLLVEVPGWAATRYAAERAIRQRGWRLALSPADADALVTCGAPGPRMAHALDLVWAQLPGPRTRVAVSAPSAVDAAFAQAAASLVDTDRQRADAARRSTEPVMGGPAEGADPDAEDTDHGDTDHGDMGMRPGGIPLAGGAEDRDGLEMDVLHVPLGPVLPCWPAGLLLHCTLSGDVVTAARPEVLGAAGDAVLDPPPRRAAAVDRLDRAARLLVLAGWEKVATDTVRLRDDLLDSDDDDDDAADAANAARVDRVVGRVRRSRLLRWSLRGAGPIDMDTCHELGLHGRSAGDVHDRLVTLLWDARSALDGRSLPAPVPLDALARLLPGRELGAVRLMVASLDVDTGVRTATPAAAP